MKTVATRTQPIHFMYILAVTAAILCIPLIGMSVSDEWNWTVMNFVVMGTLIFATGLCVDWFARHTNGIQKSLGIVTILIGFVLVWAELATGAVERLVLSLFS